MYLVTALVRHHERSDELHVVYASLDTGMHFVRPLYATEQDPDGWNTPTKDGKVRFEGRLSHIAASATEDLMQQVDKACEEKS